MMRLKGQATKWEIYLQLKEQQSFYIPQSVRKSQLQIKGGSKYAEDMAEHSMLRKCGWIITFENIRIRY